MTGVCVCVCVLSLSVVHCGTLVDRKHLLSEMWRDAGPAPTRCGLRAAAACTANQVSNSRNTLTILRYGLIRRGGVGAAVVCDG